MILWIRILYPAIISELFVRIKMDFSGFVPGMLESTDSITEPGHLPDSYTTHPIQILQAATHPGQPVVTIREKSGLDTSV
jgi:hypothetical protein